MHTTDARPGVVVRLPSRLGDFVLSLPAAHAVAPDVVIVTPELSALAREALPGVQVLAVARGWAGFVRGVADLRRIRPRRAVLVPASRTSAALCALAGIPERWGEPSGARGLLLTRHVTPSTMPQHLASYLLEIATGTRPTAPPTPRIEPSGNARTSFANLYPGSGKPIGIFPGSSSPSRQWPSARFREVVQRLHAAGQDVVVFGGPHESTLTRKVAGTQAHDLGGRTDLVTMGAGLARCRLLVTNDTGPMHLAAAVGTPVVAFFGPDRPARVAPLVTPHRVLVHEEIPCLGCRRRICPRQGPGTVLPSAVHECLQLISVDEAMAAIGALLGKA
jgi:ADP-heptose:LPS heptosyltransferase